MDKTKKAVLLVQATRELLNDGRVIILERQVNYHNSTLGEILVKGITFDTIELPWKDNKKNISCIPPGVYTWQKIKRTSNGKNALYIRGVKDRTEILIHYGTMPQHSEGCILLPQYERFHTMLNTKGLLYICH